MSSRTAPRKDSSSSTLNTTPISPVPSSVEVLPKAQQERKRRAKARDARGETSAVEANGSGSGEGSKVRRVPASKSNATLPGEARPATRNRSGSLQERGAAVLRALARAEEDAASDISVSHDGVNGRHSTHEEDDDDSGYDGEVNSGQPNVMPEPVANGNGTSLAAFTSTQAHDVATPPVLTEEQKELGRQARSGIRKRQEIREVERITKTSQGKKSTGRRGIASERKKPKSWEIPRKIFHSSIGFMVLYLYLSRADLRKIVKGLSSFLGIVITADVIRLNSTRFEWLYERVLGFLMRETEKEKVNGVVWYLIGVLFCLHFMPEDVACVSIMILSWADTSASVFGRLFGKYTPPLPSPPFATRKSLAGTMAAAFMSTCTAALFWLTPIAQFGRRSLLATEGRGAIPWPVLCLGSGIVGGIAEALELGGVDDNLSLPILSALGIQGLSTAWRWLFG